MTVLCTYMQNAQSTPATRLRPKTSSAITEPAPTRAYFGIGNALANNSPRSYVSIVSGIHIAGKYSTPRHMQVVSG